MYNRLCAHACVCFLLYAIHTDILHGSLLNPTVEILKIVPLYNLLIQTWDGLMYHALANDPSYVNAIRVSHMINYL